jgi:O-antigen ligase
VIVSVRHAEYPFVSIKQIFLLLIYVLLNLSIIVSCKNKQSLAFIYKGLIYISLALFAFEIFNILTLGKFAPKFGNESSFFYRPRSFFREANEFGQYLVFIIGLIIPAIILKKAIINFKLILICFLLDLFLLIPNMSRGSWLGACGAIFVIILCLYKLGRIRFRVLTILKTGISLYIIISIILIIIPKIFPIKFADNIYDVISARIVSFAMFKDETINVRYSYNIIGLQCVEKSPITGIGYGNLFSVLPFGYDLTTEHDKIPIIGNATTSNFIMDIASETGLLGISCFLILLLHALATGYKNVMKAKDEDIRTMSLGTLAAMVGLILNGISYASHMLPFLWVSIGMTYSLRQMIKKQTFEPYPPKRDLI